MHELNYALSSRDLLDFLLDLRLLAEVEHFEAKSREEEALKEAKPTIEGTAENVSRFFKRAISQNAKKAEEARKNEAAFRLAHPSLLTYARAIEARNLLFFGDERGEARLALAFACFLDADLPCAKKEIGFAAVSRFLFGDEGLLLKRFASFEGHLQALLPDLKKEKAKARGLIYSGALGLLCLPGAMVATTAAIPFASLLASLGLAAEATAFATSLVAFLSGTEKLLSLQEEEEAFRRLDSSSLSFLLASELTFVEHYRDTLGKEEFKRELDELLQRLESKKGDLDYFSFVEGKKKEEGYAKIRCFHVFDERLMDLV